jgi:nitronate monooxygenase
MPLPEVLQGRLRLPVVGAPMFIVSNPDLVIEQCKAGIVGSFPALNARPKAQLQVWLERITSELAAFPGAAPYAVNQIIHGSNERLAHDMEVCDFACRSSSPRCVRPTRSCRACMAGAGWCSTT